MTLTNIGRYSITRELGRGGMATVYLAHDPFFKRDVAVKILPREFLHDPAFRARFEREAQTIAALEHSAIVPVYDYGEEDGQPYLVMRLMTGGSLADVLARQVLSPRDTLNIFARLAPAMDRAHGLGIIHRDLKPGNILFDGDGHPYIADFGLAKIAEASTQLSATGVMGTPAYMSPEQARGDKQIDRRADLYALGVILYQMLTRKVPYEADTPMGVAFKHVTEPPPRLRDARPDLSPEAEALITRAMAKDPRERFDSAASMLAALEPALTAPPTPALSPAPRGTPTAATIIQTGDLTDTAPLRAVSLPPDATRPPPAATQVQPPPPAATWAQSPPPSNMPPPRPAPKSGARWLLPVLLGVLALFVVGGLIAAGFTALSMLNGAATATPRVEPHPTETDLAVLNATDTLATPATGAPLVPTDTPEPPTPSPTETPSPEPSPTVPAAGATAISESDGMVQVFVPAGEFTMGNNLGPPDQQPEHKVYLDAYWVDQTEVTNSQYALCVGAGVCSPPLVTGSMTRGSYYGVSDFAAHPVLYVNWPQAQTYCEWAGRRLLTEAEWEKAARGEAGQLYPWGDEAPDAARLNYGPSGVGDTVAVGQYLSGASPHGALDMAGNAWEWVADWYDAGYYAVSPAENPTGPAQTGCPEGDCRVLRGGSWDSGADTATTTVRLFYGPNDTRDAFTIRCGQTHE